MSSADDQTTTTTSSELRADIRRLGDLLGETLVRQEGPELLDLVEKVRRLTREDGEAAAELLRGTELETAAKLVRAFSTYFHLANVTEQVHRGRELGAKRAAEGGLLARTADRLKDADPDHLRETVRHLNVRPVFTAHPTEAARRSVLNKLRRIAALLDTPVNESDRRRLDTRLAENIDLVWQTDELRVVRPEPADEARNAIYYLDELHAGAVGDVLEDLTAELERAGVKLPDDTRPLTFGTWIGGDRDGNPNVTPQVTWDVLILQHEHGINDALEMIDELRGFLSNSIRYAGATEELLSSLQTDLERLPEISPRYKRLNAEEPYRLKATCIRQKLENTKQRLAKGTPTRTAATTSAPPSSSTTCASSRPRCASTAAVSSPTAASPAPSAPWPPSASSSPPWTSANTPTPTTTPSASSSTGSARSPGATPTCPATTAPSSSPRSCVPAGRSPPARPPSTRRARRPSASSRPSAAPWRSSGPRSSSPTSSPCARAPTTSSPRRCWPARPD